MGIKETPLHDWHKNHGAKLTAFGGYEMPLSYEATGSAAEHIAVRRDAGGFDVSHMRRFYISGPGSVDLLQYVLTNDVSRLKPGGAQYSSLVKHGAIRPLTLDDVYLYRLDDSEFLLIVNAGNGLADLEYITEIDANRKYGTVIRDETDAQSLIAVQGPRSREILEQLLGSAAMQAVSSPNRITRARFNGDDRLLVASTGYTGEPTRFEVVVPAEHVDSFWSANIELGATPAGLAARDSLRVEDGLPLYGHELNQGISLVEAGFGFAVKPDKDAQTIGRRYYKGQKEALSNGTLGRQPVLLELKDKRQLDPQKAVSNIIHDGQVIGYVTSSVVAPMVRDRVHVKDRGLAIGYVTRTLPHEERVMIDVRGSGRLQEATVLESFLKKEFLVDDGKQYVQPETYYLR